MDWVVGGFLVSLLLSVVGCATPTLNSSENLTSDESMVVGFVQVEASGPFFRIYQDEVLVRFFDVRNIQTGEWTRVDTTKNTKRFVTWLPPGHYELFRVQIGEGPFRSEALVKMSFDVVASKTNYLGVWRLRVDPPKTIRMLQWEILAETENVDPVQVLHSILGEHPLMVSMLQPESNQSRLFAVAPSQPRAKYFYRR